MASWVPTRAPLPESSIEFLLGLRGGRRKRGTQVALGSNHEILHYVAVGIRDGGKGGLYVGGNGGGGRPTWGAEDRLENWRLFGLSHNKKNSIRDGTVGLYLGC